MNLGKELMHVWSCNHTTIRILEIGKSINQSTPGMRNELFCVFKWHEQLHQPQSEGPIGSIQSDIIG